MPIPRSRNTQRATHKLTPLDNMGTGQSTAWIVSRRPDFDPATIEHFTRGNDVAGIERPELREPGAGFVKAHTIDDVGEELWILGPQRHAPFPVVKADRDRNELLHLA